MRRGVGVYEQLVKRFTAQTTDYQQLLSTFAEGLYTEMDFRNEVGRIGMLRPSLVAGILSAYCLHRSAGAALIKAGSLWRAPAVLFTICHHFCPCCCRHCCRSLLPLTAVASVCPALLVLSGPECHEDA